VVNKVWGKIYLVYFSDKNYIKQDKEIEEILIMNKKELEIMIN
jgi:hypothetical protein